MSLKITLYAGCKLTSQYNQVFKDRTTMETYLGSVPHLDVYTGDDIYFTNSGTISIDNESLLAHSGDQYNYMQFTTGAGGIYTKRFAFVNNITVVNEVAVIEYSEDIWHTYAIDTNSHKINLFNSLLEQAKTLNGGTGYEYTASQIASLPKALPIQPEGQNSPKWREQINPDLNETWCHVVVIASMYKLVSQDVVNERITSCYLLSRKEKITGGITPFESSKQYYFTIDSQLLDILISLKAKSSDTDIHNRVLDEANWKYDIEDIILIPESMADIFDSVISSDSLHNNGLHQDFEIDGFNYNDLDSSQTSYHTFTTEIGFNNLIQNDFYRYTDNDGHTKYNFNGFPIRSKVQYTRTFEADYKYVAIGNMSRIIPITFDGKTKNGIYEFCFNQYDCSIKFLFNNTITDITSDLRLNLPISVQSADITQQQKIALRTGNVVQQLELVGQGFALGANIGTAVATHGGSMQSDLGGSSSRMLGQAINLFGGGYQLDSRNQAQYIKNKVIDVDDISIKNCILGGLREIEMVYNNGTLLDSIINTYGYTYKLLVNSFDTVYSANNYVKFTKANVYGNYSQAIANGLANILENGVILL